jgi:hypothetical protein
LLFAFGGIDGLLSLAARERTAAMGLLLAAIAATLALLLLSGRFARKM